MEIQHVRGNDNNPGNEEGANLYFLDEMTDRDQELQDALASCSGVTAEQRKRLDQVLKAEILPLPKTLPTVKTTHHHINVCGHKPIRQRFRRVSPRKYQAICKEVDTMLKSQAIESSKSPWSLPIVMVPKANETYRFCIDFREVNETSDKDAYP